MRNRLLTFSLVGALLTANPAVAEPPVVAQPAAPSGKWAWGILVPGLGQIVLGDPLRGLVFLAGTLTVPIVGAGLMAKDYKDSYNTARPWEPTGSPAFGNAVMYGTIAAFGGLWLWSVIDAYLLDGAKAAVGASAPPQLGAAVPEPAPLPTAQPFSSTAAAFAPVQAIILGGQALAPQAKATLRWFRQEGSWVMTVENLPPAPEGRTYQLWLATTTGKLSLGIFQANPLGTAVLKATLGTPGLVPVAAMVTIEPLYGTAQPSGDNVLLGVF